MKIKDPHDEDHNMDDTAVMTGEKMSAKGYGNPLSKDLDRKGYKWVVFLFVIILSYEYKCSIVVYRKQYL